MRMRKDTLFGAGLLALVVSGAWITATLHSEAIIASTGSRTMAVVRLYTGSVNKSHFEDLQIPLKEGGKVGFLSDRVHRLPASCSVRLAATTTTNSTRRHGGNTWSTCKAR